MLSGKKILAVIAARGGSKGLPRKNLRNLAGKPLIAWSILEAQKSRFIDSLIVSSEDDEILSVAQEWGAEVPFIRPAELAQDDTPGTAAVMHAVLELPGFDLVVLLQPTSPLRTALDIDLCIKLAVSNQAVSAVSVTQTEKSAYWTCTIDQASRINFLFDEKAMQQRRQQLPETFVLNGAVYVADIQWFKQSNKLVSDDTLCYEMPRARSIDIDSEIDFVMCEAMVSHSANTAK